MLKTRSGKVVGKNTPEIETDIPFDRLADVPITSFTLVWEPELCRQLARSRYTVRRWVAEGRFPPPLTITEQGRAWRVRDIEAWLTKIARSRRKPKPRGALKRGNVLVRADAP